MELLDEKRLSALEQLGRRSPLNRPAIWRGTELRGGGSPGDLGRFIELDQILFRCTLKRSSIPPKRRSPFFTKDLFHHFRSRSWIMWSREAASLSAAINDRAPFTPPCTPSHPLCARPFSIIFPPALWKETRWNVITRRVPDRFSTHGIGAVIAEKSSESVNHSLAPFYCFTPAISIFSEPHLPLSWTRGHSIPLCGIGATVPVH